MKTKRAGIIALCTAAVFTFMSLQAIAAEKKMAKSKINTKTVELRLALRDLWIGHIFWVRNEVLMTKLGNTDAAKAASDKAVENAKAIANSVSPFYGQGASDKLFSLLAGHYGAIKEYMAATYDMKKDAQSEATDQDEKECRGDSCLSEWRRIRRTGRNPLWHRRCWHMSDITSHRSISLTPKTTPERPTRGTQ